MLKYTITKVDSGQKVHLQGALDDLSNSILIKLGSQLESQQIEFQCEEIGTINSFGAREWIDFLLKLPADKKLLFSRCSSVFMSYRIMIPSMTRDGDILSIVVNYECKHCRTVTNKVIDKADFSQEYEFGVVSCSACGNDATVKEDSEELFSFIES